MSLMLPSPPSSDARLTDVLPSCYASLGVEGQPNTLGLTRASAVVLVLVDGLGFMNLADSLGHAPFLRGHFERVVRMSTVFPSTTASALASLATGELPGTHGILGYRIMNPDTGNIINQLSGLTDVADLTTWLGVPTLHERAHDAGKTSCIVGLPRFEKSPLTRVVHAGARYVGENSVSRRVTRACDEVASGTDFVMLYIPELDQVAHAQGVTSTSWLAALEEVDGALRALVTNLPGGVEVYLTADHGVIDVPAARHVDVVANDWELEGNPVVGGEPRGLQIFAREGTPHREIADAALHVADAGSWQERVRDVAWVLTPEDLVEAGVWGHMSTRFRLRAGELVVVPKNDDALYDARTPRAEARGMVGQHGGMSEREMLIPWLRLTGADSAK
jgi:hypothetical protein